MPKKPSHEEWPHQSQERVPLTADLVEGFVSVFLRERFDNPKETPPLHREIWKLFCDPHPLVALAAPRGHAKSTAGTLSFTLAALLFGAKDHILIISATETMASDHLKDIGVELEENEEIRNTFNVRLVTFNGIEIIGYVGGRMFRVVCKGAEQRVRGIKWRHKRPDLILIDDLEDDEAVQSVERRIKLREWIDNAVQPMGGDTCQIRALGTILHFDSWLSRVMNTADWLTKNFPAHKDFDDFSNILWPEKFPESRLRAIRQRYINNNNPSGYCQEYLGRPIADSDSYFRRDDFIDMTEEDHASPKNYYVGGDFAISKADRANCTSFTIGGIDPHNMLHIVDNRTGRWDSLQICETMFEIQRAWEPDVWFLEKGQIEETLMPFLRLEMVRRGLYLNIKLMKADKDKPARAQAFKARMRAGGVRHNKDAEWYYPYEMELLQFPRSSTDDRVDATAWLGRGCDYMAQALSHAEQAELDLEEEELEHSEDGRNPITGY